MSSNYQTTTGAIVTAATPELAAKIGQFMELQGYTSAAQVNAAIDAATLVQLKPFLKLLIQVTP
jgi:hypothetical protein